MLLPFSRIQLEMGAQNSPWTVFGTVVYNLDRLEGWGGGEREKPPLPRSTEKIPKLFPFVTMCSAIWKIDSFCLSFLPHPTPFHVLPCSLFVGTGHERQGPSVWQGIPFQKQMRGGGDPSLGQQGGPDSFQGTTSTNSGRLARRGSLLHWETDGKCYKNHLSSVNFLLPQIESHPPTHQLLLIYLCLFSRGESIRATKKPVNEYFKLEGGVGGLVYSLIQGHS